MEGSLLMCSCVLLQPCRWRLLRASSDCFCLLLRGVFLVPPPPTYPHLSFFLFHWWRKLTAKGNTRILHIPPASRHSDFTRQFDTLDMCRLLARFNQYLIQGNGKDLRLAGRIRLCLPRRTKGRRAAVAKGKEDDTSALAQRLTQDMERMCRRTETYVVQQPAVPHRSEERDGMLHYFDAARRPPPR